MLPQNYSSVPSFVPLDTAGRPRMTAAECCLAEHYFDSLLGSQRLGLTEVTQSTAPWPTELCSKPCHRAAQTLAGQVAAFPGASGEQLLHCFTDPFATGGDFEPFTFSKKLLQQKKDLLLESAHLTDGAWPVEAFP